MERVQPTSATTTGMDARSQDRPAARGAVPTERSPAGQAEPAASMTLPQAVNLVNRELLLAGRELAFSVDEASGRTVIEVVHATTGEVVRQIPNEAVLAVAARLQAGDRLDSLGIDAWV
jgi:flagellar protein FlaG